MKYVFRKITIGEMLSGLEMDKGIITCFDGKIILNGPYQRDFFYEKRKKERLIETILSNFPIGLFYVYQPDSSKPLWQVIDGKQRIETILNFAADKFSIKGNDRQLYYHGLTEKQKEELFAYELIVCVISECSRESVVKLIEKVNTTGVNYNEGELKNVSFPGMWLEHAKKYFNDTNKKIKTYRKYMNGRSNRMEYVQVALKWVSSIHGISIDEYISRHAGDNNADELISDFEEIMKWVTTTFPTYRKEMAGLDWGTLYRQYRGKSFDPLVMESKLRKMYANPEITKHKGIYQYVLSNDERSLDLRSFTDTQKRTMYEMQGCKCNLCGKPCSLDEMEAHHIVEWREGGRTIIENGEMLCKDCHLEKHHKKRKI